MPHALPTLVLVAAFAIPASAQQGEEAGLDPELAPRPHARAAPATGRIAIDGRLTEADWDRAPQITEFIQAQPNQGRPASERTIVRLLYDENFLYISAVCLDSDPDGIVIGTIERDYPGVLSEDMDAFGITLDTFNDRRNSFIFFVNPRAGLKDGQGFDNGRTRDYGWDGIVNVRTVVHDSGWTVEMAIPLKTLRFDPSVPDHTWGLNLSRRVRRKNEVAYWAPLDRRDRIFRMDRSGTLDGMGRLRAGRNITAKPFVLAANGAGNNINEDDRGNGADAGFDLKYGITPRLTLDLTFRTDFSQVEVDQEQVNLTRFALFFPERREFFLENSGTFTFGDVGGPGFPRSGTSLRDFTLFHSREIGLEGGRPVPLIGGARVTGRVGETELGLLNVQSERFDGDPAENFSVVRARRRLFPGADVGVMFTNRQGVGTGAGSAYNRSGGVDFTARIAQRLFIDSYLAFSRTDTTGGEAARLAVGWRDRLWDVSAALRNMDPEFDPGVGFVRRTGIRHWYGTVGIHPRPNLPQVLEINPYVEGHLITNLSGLLESRNGEVGLGVSFEDGGRLTFSGNDRFERLFQPFRVRTNASFPIGDYHFREGSARYVSSNGRALSVAATVSGGGFFDGSRFTVDGSVRWQPDYHLTMEFEATHNELSVQGQDFTADLYALRVSHAFTTTAYLGAFVQYNESTDEVIVNARFNLIHAPLSDFFLVFTERRDLDADAVRERFVTAKVTRLLAF